MDAGSKRVQHETIVVDRVFAASPMQVFAAFADVKARERWAKPSGDELKYLEDDFTPGGRDVFRCGSPGALIYRGDVRYESIVPNARIVYVETLTREGAMLSSALVTMQMIPANGGTLLRMTAQMAVYDESGMADGYREGWQSVLENLEEELRK